MHKIIQFILGISLLSFAQDTCAQTPYSSQNFNLNNFFNPATSGFGINNKIQTLFRTQYEGVGSAYRSIGIAADFALLRKNSYDKNNLLTKHTFYNYTWFDFGTWKVDLWLTGENNNVYHGPDVYTNYYNGAALAEKLGIKKVYFLNHDYVLKD